MSHKPCNPHMVHTVPKHKPDPEIALCKTPNTQSQTASKLPMDCISGTLQEQRQMLPRLGSAKLLICRGVCWCRILFYYRVSVGCCWFYEGGCTGFAGSSGLSELLGTVGSSLLGLHAVLLSRQAVGMNRTAQLPAMSVPKPSWIRKNAAMPQHCSMLFRSGSEVLACWNLYPAENA